MSYKPKHFDIPDDNTIYEEGSNLLPYVLSEEIAIALDVAFATGRPLLVAGPPGCGKSRLADAVALLKKWNFLSHTMTSRTRLEELTGEPDHLQRLHDAHVQNGKLKPDWAYLKPGVFWWVYEPESAKNRGGEKDEAEDLKVTLKYPDAGIERKAGHHTVLLLDEIDKAEPDLPNDLLEPLDRKSFSIPNGGFIEAKKDLSILTIITTNRERDLPQAFLRRCVILNIKPPNKTELIKIGKKHYPKATLELLEELAEQIELLAKQKEQIRKPGTSEFLDAVRACIKLDLEVDKGKWQEIWPQIKQAVMIKDILG